jgi:transposase
MQLVPRKTFSEQFKRNAVKKSLESPDTVNSVAAALGVHPSTLSRWRTEMTSKKKTKNPIPNNGPSKSLAQLEKENRQLKKRLELAEMENVFLKEAKEFFDSRKE